MTGQNSTPFQNIPRKNLLPGKTSSDETFESIVNWMEDCDLTHTRCKPAVSDLPASSEVPKRVLELQGTSITLRENLPNVARYACLSHCWGDTEGVLRTTLRNLEEFKSGIHWNDLPKNFRDAVDICRRLDIKFLWIDSLCIIQDSEEDWNDQASKMGSIYENAYFTIAATKSNTSAGGCYSTTESEFLGKCVTDTDIYVRKQPPELPTDGMLESPEEWPLLHRGWVYQEMRLSHRVLHFCSQEVIWECREWRKSESGCSDENIGRDAPRYQFTMHNAVPYWKLSEEPRRLWYRTVQEYSRLQLTFRKDKFPALAALTHQMEKLRINDHFLVGIWKKTLLFDLLWMVWPSPETGRPAALRPPTWTWACVQSEVIWDSSVDEVLRSIQVLYVPYASKVTARMGEIQGAGISLRAHLIRASYQSRDLSLVSRRSSLNEIVVSDKKFDYDLSIPGKYCITSGTDLFIMPVGIDKVNHSHMGLVLRKRPAESLYERVGYVTFQHQDILQDWQSEVRRSRSDENRLSQGEKEKRVESVTSALTGLPLYNVTIV